MQSIIIHVETGNSFCGSVNRSKHILSYTATDRPSPDAASIIFVVLSYAVHHIVVEKHNITSK